MVQQEHSQRYVIAGGSGFLGLSLAEHLVSFGHSVVILSRSVPQRAGDWDHQCWDGRTLGVWKDCLEGADGLINLAGRSVNCVKTPDHRDEILRSRVESTRVLGEAMRAIENPPPVWCQMSTAHIYGDPPTVWCSERSPVGYGLAPFVGKAWEEAFQQSVLPTQRRVTLRTGFVIGRDRGAGGGAMSMLIPLAKWGLGGRVGSGTQGMSWIHETDFNRLCQQALHDEMMKGVYVASAPNPVSQVEFMKELRRSFGMPIGLPAYGWMVRFGATYLLRTDPELALYGRYVFSERLRDEGFVFEFPDLRSALANL